MATIMLIFLIALGLAAVLGATIDTRDSADWSRTDWSSPAPRDRLRC